LFLDRVEDKFQYVGKIIPDTLLKCAVKIRINKIFLLTSIPIYCVEDWLESF